MTYALYTYQTVNGALDAHAYGPTDQASAQLTGENLQASQKAVGAPALGFMVLPVEKFPLALTQQDAPGGRFVLYTYDPDATPQCVVYAKPDGEPWGDQDAAFSAGLQLTGEAPIQGPHPRLTATVLPLEAMPV